MVIVSRRGDYTDRAYPVLGEGMKKDDFASRLNDLAQRRPEQYHVVLNVYERIRAVDILAQPDVASRLDEVRPDFAVSLQMYLLCTCADALMKHKRKTTRSRFYGFFTDLPDAAKRSLADPFCIRRFIGGTKKERPGHEWETMNLDQRVEAITDYLYECHRNPFTHEAELCGGLSPASRERFGFDEDPLPGFWETWQHETSNEYFILGYNKNPVRVLRHVIVTGAQTYHLVPSQPKSSAAG